MSQQIADNFYDAWVSGLFLTSQVFENLMTPSYTTKPVNGERTFFDGVGQVKAQRKEGRQQDIPISETPHRRRWIHTDHHWTGDYIDSSDQLNVLNDPTNAYAMAHGGACNRAAMRIIVEGALGANQTGKKGETSVSLPAENIVAEASSGMTLAKLKRGKPKLARNKALAMWPADPIYLYWTQYQAEELTDELEVTSRDFARDKVLVDGRVSYYYGTNFIEIEDEAPGDPILPYVGTTRQLPMFVRSGLCVGFWKNTSGEVWWDGRKKSFLVSAEVNVGATREQESKMIRVDVSEPASY